MVEEEAFSEGTRAEDDEVEGFVCEAGGEEGEGG